MVPFDPKTARVTGRIAPAVDRIVWENVAGIEGAWFAVSPGGHLAYVTGNRPEISTRPVWIDKTGHETGIDVPPGLYLGPQISPDGHRVAFTRMAPNGVGQSWVLDVDGGRLLPVLSQGADYNGTWTPDQPGRLTYTSNGDLFETDINGQGSPVRLISRENYQFPTSWSPDGRTLAFMDITPTRTQIFTMERDGAPQPLLQSTANSGSAKFSPRGGWLAYVSDETGQFEVYVRPFPGSQRGVQVSKGGGVEPIWSRDGRELFYRNGDRMLRVKMATQPVFRAEEPIELWRRHYFAQNFLAPNYDVAPDGRFLMLQATEDTAKTVDTMNVVIGWFSEFSSQRTNR